MKFPVTSELHICSLNCQSSLCVCVFITNFLGVGSVISVCVSVFLLSTNLAQLCPDHILSINGL